MCPGWFHNLDVLLYLNLESSICGFLPSNRPKDTHTCAHECACVQFTFWLRHAKLCLLAYADNEGQDQSAHPCILIRAFTARSHNYWILQNV